MKRVRNFGMKKIRKKRNEPIRMDSILNSIVSNTNEHWIYSRVSVIPCRNEIEEDV